MRCSATANVFFHTRTRPKNHPGFVWTHTDRQDYCGFISSWRNFPRPFKIMSFSTFMSNSLWLPARVIKLFFNLFFQVIKKDIQCKWPHNNNPTDILLDSLLLAQFKTEPSFIMVYVPLSLSNLFTTQQFRILLMHHSSASNPLLSSHQTEGASAHC